MKLMQLAIRELLARWQDTDIACGLSLDAGALDVSFLK